MSRNHRPAHLAFTCAYVEGTRPGFFSTAIYCTLPIPTFPLYRGKQTSMALDDDQGTHSNCIFEFLVLPVFSLSDRKFSLCQFMSFLTNTYTKLTLQTYPASKEIWKFSLQVSKYLLPLESGNLQLKQTKFSVFSLHFTKISKFPKGFSPIFPVFLCSGYPGRCMWDKATFCWC